MKLAGYEVKVIGEVPDQDIVLLEDAVLFLNGKVQQTELREISCVAGGYDLLVRFRNQDKLARLRRNSIGEWHIELPSAIDAVVQKLPV